MTTTRTRTGPPGTVPGRSDAPVLPTTGAAATLAPLGTAGSRITGGFWGDRLATNRQRSLDHAFDQLRGAGTLDNLRLAAGIDGKYRAFADTSGLVFGFVDTDVYKWLEAVGWELGRAPDADLAGKADEAIALIAAAQRPDGYLNSFVQVVRGGEPYQDLAWGHEFYCVGHLVQAAVAWHRALGDDRLLAIAIRVVDHVDRTFGAGSRDGIDGHPEIEMALVELFRTTGERRYLDLAARMIELRGHGLLGEGRFGPAYWQDHEPVREATAVAGHAVRQLYLDCGAVDVAVETGDKDLLEAVRRRWADMVATRSYLTGGLGSRARDEAFGDPFELPPDQAYAETCAAIASVMLAWRLLLATGDPACADVMERTIYNGMLPGVSVDGTAFFYVNVLQRRSRRAASDHAEVGRAPWYPCACCPPNVMRTLASWPQYLATTDADGIQIQQYATGEIDAVLGAGDVRLAVATDYPWNGRVAVTVAETPDVPWTLSLRVPGWCRSATVEVGQEGARATGPDERLVGIARTWRAGDTVVLDLAMPGRITEPDPRIDAIRGCVALERGPLVYCLETADLPGGTDLEDLEIDTAVEPQPVLGRETPGADVGLRVQLRRRGSPDSAEGTDDAADPAPIVAEAGPYLAWANRAVEAMRVWVPAAATAPAEPSNSGR